jgi:hypothetical protein
MTPSYSSVDWEKARPVVEALKKAPFDPEYKDVMAAASWNSAQHGSDSR